MLGRCPFSCTLAAAAAKLAPRTEVRGGALPHVTKLLSPDSRQCGVNCLCASDPPVLVQPGSSWTCGTLSRRQYCFIGEGCHVEKLWKNCQQQLLQLSGAKSASLPAWRQVERTQLGVTAVRQSLSLPAVAFPIRRGGLCIARTKQVVCLPGWHERGGVPERAGSTAQPVRQGDQPVTWLYINLCPAATNPTNDDATVEPAWSTPNWHPNQTPRRRALPCS